MMNSCELRSWSWWLALAAMLCVGGVYIYALQQDQEKYEVLDAVINSSSYGMSIVDDHGQVVAWSKASQEVTGWSFADIKASGGTLRPIMEDKQWTLHAQKYFNKLRTLKGKVVVTRCTAIRPDGTTVPIRVTIRAVRLPNGKYYGVGHIDKLSNVVETPPPKVASQ